MKKHCHKCGKLKDCRYKGPTCTHCYQKDRPVDVERRRERGRKNVRTLVGRFNYAKAQAKKRGIAWNLSLKQFDHLTSKNCFYCDGDLPEVGTGLDRIEDDKTVGYREDNVIPCCGGCNHLRGHRLSVLETKTAVLAFKDQRQRAINDYLEYGVHLDLRHIFISGEIDSEMAARVSKSIDELEALNPKRPIQIHIMSEGGSWPDALAIYDRILRTSCPTVAIGTGLVASAATAILQAAQKRLVTPNCSFLIHDGTETFEGTPKSLESFARASQADRMLLYRIYSQRSGKPVAYWEKHCSQDTWMDAESVVQAGLADEILKKTE